jgi:carboxyl-terminal processing protease
MVVQLRSSGFPSGGESEREERTLKEDDMSQWKRIGNFKIASVIFAVFLIGVLIGSGQSQKVSALSNNMYEDLKVFTDVIGLIQKDYVEETKSKDLIQGAIKGMLETLDPHSAYMPPTMFKEMQEETKGRFEGLGIEITLKDGILTVVSPIEGTPAFKAGVVAGDQIIKIDGETTKNFTLVDSVKRLRGPRGTKVTITIMRRVSQT